VRKVIAVLISLGIVLYAFGSIASAAPSLAGTWTATTKKVTPTACSAVTVALTLVQCGTGNLVRGTLSLGTISIPVVGKVRSNGLTIDIQGSTETSTNSYDGLIVGTYASGSPATIKFTSMGWTNISLVTFNQVYEYFDTITLAKK
jgi:hypothetical protein